MKRIAYGETIIATESAVADRILRYAALLAGSGAAATVTFPGRVSDGPVEPVTMLIGPASQLTAWEVPEPFPGDTAAVQADLERRIRALSADIGTSPERSAGETAGFEELEGPTGA